MFEKLMKDRYGADQLSVVLLITSIVLRLLARMKGLSILNWVVYLPLAFAVYMMFSKDVDKRRLENYKFSIFISPIYGRYKKLENKFKERKIYKYFKCPACKSQLKVPRAKGKIVITCPKCSEKFEGRT